MPFLGVFSFEIPSLKIERMPKKATSEIEKKAEFARHVWKAWSQISQDVIDTYVASGLRSVWTPFPEGRVDGSLIKKRTMFFFAF